MSVFKYYKKENDTYTANCQAAGVNEIFAGGDKSITHRALLFAAIADGESIITNPSQGLDCAATADALEKLGVGCKYIADANAVKIAGCGGVENLKEPRCAIDCKNSATTARLLMGLLAGAAGRRFVLTGDASLKRRPMRRVAEPLEAMGAKISLGLGGNCLPAKISGAPLKKINYLNINSSAQVKASIIFAAMCAEGKTSIDEIYKTRDHSELMAAKFGLKVKRTTLKPLGFRASVEGGQKAFKAAFKIPNDPSGASFYIALDALFQALYSRRLGVVTRGVLINETRNGFFDRLFDCGFDVLYTNCKKADYIEKTADIQINYTALSPVMPLYIESTADIISMIDEVPLMALVLSLAQGESYIGGLMELRLKETDRLSAIAGELNKMGADIRVKCDALVIRGVKKLKGARLNSYGDHRMAMMLVIAGILSGEDFSVKNCGCVSISHPDFFDNLRKIGFKFHIKRDIKESE